MGFFDLFKASENKRLKAELSELQGKYDALAASIPKEKKDFDALQEQTVLLKTEITRLNLDKSRTQEELEKLKEETGSVSGKLSEQQTALSKLVSNIQKLQQLYKQYQAAIKGYEKEPDNGLETVVVKDELLPVVEVDLNCMNVRDLRNRYKQNQREIQKVFKRYDGRYTTKANSAIYQLMVIAMEAELQNVLSTLSHGKLDDAISSIRAITNRYYEVAVEGNQSIAPTMKSFIGEIEFLFIETIKVEYEYYVKREQQREEQRELREKMRQEAEEQKQLEIEKKKVEKEEAKYNNEIQQLNEKISAAKDEEAIRKFQERIAELEKQVAEVQAKKEQIVNLQNGKAGHVYVISNLGSFGENVFKVGMTRRPEPMDRIRELGNASVPFEFDVHSFIFSNDAVALETALHKALNQKRVNKVNLRKEFFRVSLDELEELVLSFDPTAEFKRTMVAEQYYQSLERTDVVPEISGDIDEEDTE